MNKKGYIVFSTSKSWISKVIKFFRKSEWSHTFVILGELEGVKDSPSIIGEAMEYGVRLAPLSKYENKETKLEVWSFFAPTKKIDEAICKSSELVGRLYGFFQLVGFVWVWLFHKLKIKKQNPFTDGIICSEFVFYFLHYAGYNLKTLDANNTAPDDLLELFKLDPLCKKEGNKEFGQDLIEWVK